MNTRLWWRLILCAVMLLVQQTVAWAEIEIVLQNEFIEQYKNRVTIDVDYVVDKAHKKPNPASKDGDLHVAGRAEQVKLPIVAEIMNAKDEPDGVDRIHEVEGSGETIAMSGAWRIWCEHGGTSQQVQGQPLKAFTTTNPSHVFEIHPITNLDGRSLLDSLKEIKGYKPKKADIAFAKYEGIACKITPDEETTTITTRMAGYNYAEFAARLTSRVMNVEDGRFVMAEICDLEGELLVRNLRLAFLKESEPEKQTRGGEGELVHLLGIPRIDLALVSWRTKAASGEHGRKEVLTWGLPYEMIVVGYYGVLREDENEESESEETASKPSLRRRFIPRDMKVNNDRTDIFDHAAKRQTENDE